MYSWYVVVVVVFYVMYYVLNGKEIQYFLRRAKPKLKCKTALFSSLASMSMLFMKFMRCVRGNML